MLDGAHYFYIARDVIRLQSKNTLKTKVSQAIIVGIGHQEQDTIKRHFYDFTAPADEYNYPVRLQGKDMGPHGGDDFLNFLKVELLPYINKEYRVNREKQVLYGHSLAGYFTLYTLIKEPNLFSCFLAISPSIWWNNYEIFQYLKDGIPNNLMNIAENLFIAVGELETFMVDDANDLQQRLTAINTCPELYIALDENHASVVPTTMSRAIRACYYLKSNN
ncbi:alpha/beta hydrolase [Peribacillus sp. JNUCC 23]